MKVIGVLLFLMGCISLVYGGIRYRQQHTVLQVGDLKATTTQEKHLVIPPAVGVVSLVVGAGLVLADSRRGGSTR